MPQHGSLYRTSLKRKHPRGPVWGNACDLSNKWVPAFGIHPFYSVMGVMKKQKLGIDVFCIIRLLLDFLQ